MGVFAFCILNCLFFAACGSGNTPATNLIPSLDPPKEAPEKPLAGPKAPTEIHAQLQRLLPKDERSLRALVEGSLSHGAWDADSCNYFTDADVKTTPDSGSAVASAPLKAVYALYVSTGYEVENLPDAPKDRPKVAPRQNLPQECRLYLVQAPDVAAATTLERKVIEKLKAKGFSELSALTSPSPKGQSDPSIKRWLRVEPGEKTETAYVAYTLIVGNRFCYALETEQRTTVVGPDGKPLEHFTDSQRGSSLGGQLLLLVEFAATSK